MMQKNMNTLELGYGITNKFTVALYANYFCIDRRPVMEVGNIHFQ